MFLNPLLLVIGLAGAVIPIAIHYLTKPRAVQMPLSTIRLVHDAMQQRRSKNRLRDFLVLLARCLAVGLLAVAMARPLFIDSEVPRQFDDVEVVRVVLLDASHSMAAIDGASSRFDQAKIAASRKLRYQKKTGG